PGHRLDPPAFVDQRHAALPDRRHGGRLAAATTGRQSARPAPCRPRFHAGAARDDLKPAPDAGLMHRPGPAAPRAALRAAPAAWWCRSAKTASTPRWRAAAAWPPPGCGRAGPDRAPTALRSRAATASA